eukprot:15441240-Alexandrium_andersonii.AAC.1
MSASASPPTRRSATDTPSWQLQGPEHRCKRFGLSLPLAAPLLAAPRLRVSRLDLRGSGRATLGRTSAAAEDAQ